MWSVLYRNREESSSSSFSNEGAQAPSALTATQHHRRLQENELMDLVDLRDFNIQLARVDDSSAIQVLELADLVAEWMNDSFEHQLANLKYTTGKYADFNTVMLLPRKDRRLLMKTPTPPHSNLRRVASGQLFTAELKGAALFSRNATQEKVPVDVIHFMQESVLTNKSGLLSLVQSSAAAGLGSMVVDLNAFTVAESTPTGSQDPSLEAIIIIAVAVAAVAFLFLLVAIFWAWRYDRRNRQAYLANSKETRRSDPTTSQSTIEDHMKRTKGGVPMSEIGGDSIIGGGGAGLYPESVISEDISTSLSQYYRSGLSYTASAVNFPGRSSRMDHLNDAASVSSMESYGYSLDGYAPSQTTAPLPRDIPTAADTSGDSFPGVDDVEDEHDDTDAQDQDPEDEDTPVQDPEEKF